MDERSACWATADGVLLVPLTRQSLFLFETV